MSLLLILRIQIHRLGFPRLRLQKYLCRHLLVFLEFEKYFKIDSDFEFLEEKNVLQDNVIVIEPENQFKKSLPPDDESFPNEKSKVWGAFQDRKNSEQIMQRNSEEENKIENDKKIKKN